MNIVIIGYRGTGKGAIARSLAKRIGYKFLDTDHMIMDKHLVNVSEIFQNHGEEHFRKLEEEAVREACSEENCVVGTGGGAPMDPKNAGVMKKNSIVIMLDCTPEVIHSRICGDPNRPSLTDLADEFSEIKFMLKKRLPIYRKLADFETDTTAKEIEENVDEIVKFLKKKGVKFNAKS